METTLDSRAIPHKILTILLAIKIVILPGCPAHVEPDAPVVNGDRRFGWKSQTAVAWTDDMCNDGPMGRVPVLLDDAARLGLLSMISPGKQRMRTQKLGESNRFQCTRK